MNQGGIVGTNHPAQQVQLQCDRIPILDTHHVNIYDLPKCTRRSIPSAPRLCAVAARQQILPPKQMLQHGCLGPIQAQVRAC